MVPTDEASGSQGPKAGNVQGILDFVEIEYLVVKI